MAITLANLVTRTRTRVDFRNTTFVTDTELGVYLNDSYAELWEICAGSFQDWFVTSVDFTLTGGTEALATYALPATFGRLLALEVYPGTPMRSVVPRFTLQSPPGRLAYALGEKSLRVEPYEHAGQSYRLRYVQLCPTMAVGTDLDTRLERFSEWIVIRTAIKCRDMEESDTQSLWAELGYIRAMIDKAAAFRDAGQPEVVPDPDDTASCQWWVR